MYISFRLAVNIVTHKNNAQHSKKYFQKYLGVCVQHPLLEKTCFMKTQELLLLFEPDNQPIATQ